MNKKSSLHIINVFLTGFLLVTFLFGPFASFVDAATPQQEPEPQVEVEPALSMQLHADQSVGYLIYFRERPDLSTAYGMDWAVRGRYVVSQLQKTAERSQARVRAYLEAQKIPYKSYWIDNVIVVDQSNRATFNGLLNFSEIEILRNRRQLMLVEPEMMSPSPSSVDSIEINISRIGTDDYMAFACFRS